MQTQQHEAPSWGMARDGAGSWYTAYRRRGGALEFAFAKRQADGTWEIRIKDRALGGKAIASASRRTLTDCQRYVDRRRTSR